MRQLFVFDRFFDPFLGLSTSRPVDTMFFSFEYLMPSSFNFFFFRSIQREKENTQRKTHALSVSVARKKHLQEEQHRIARVYSFKTTARQDGGVWSSFFSGRQRLIIRWCRGLRKNCRR